MGQIQQVPCKAVSIMYERVKITPFGLRVKSDNPVSRLEILIVDFQEYILNDMQVSESKFV